MQKHGLESESVEYRESTRSIRATLAESGATAAEIAFLLNDRVELNAFASDELVAWIEAKLEEHGVHKVIPDQQMLAEAYRRQRQSAYLKDISASSWSAPASMSSRPPPDLHGHVARLLQERPESRMG